MNKGEIWLVEFPSSNGHEQAGTRPVIVIADTQVNIAVVIPFTTNVQALRFPETVEVKPSKRNCLSAVSAALVFHVRAIDKKRLRKNIGQLEDSTLKEIDAMLKQLLHV